MKKLSETVEAMLSPDWQERFKAEYWQLEFRCKSLGKMLDKWCNGTLRVEPKAPISLLSQRHYHMEQTLKLMREQADIDGIELETVKDTTLEFLEQTDNGAVYRCNACGHKLYSKDGEAPTSCSNCGRKVKQK